MAQLVEIPRAEAKSSKAMAGFLSQEMDGVTVRIRESDGYVNATEICKFKKGKLSADYFRLSEFDEFISELSDAMGIPIASLKQTIGGKGVKKHDQGTWVHPRVAIDMARWVSPKLSVRMNGWLMRFIAGDLELAVDVLKRHDEINNTNTTFTSAKDVYSKDRITVANSVSNDVLGLDAGKRAKVDKAFRKLKIEYKKIKRQNKELEGDYDETMTVVWEQCDEISDLKLMMIDMERKAEEGRKKAEEGRKKAEEGRKKVEEQMKEILRQSGLILGQNENLQEEVSDLSVTLIDTEEKIDDVNEKLDRVLPNHAPMDGLRRGEKELIVISKFENCDVKTAEKPYLVYKGQVKSIDEIKKKHVKDLTDERRRRLGRPLRRNETPRITELNRVGLNGFIPNSKQTWNRFKRDHGPHIRFGTDKTTTFSLRNWTYEDFLTALQEKDQARTTI